MQYKVSIRRKGASKWLNLMTDNGSLLSLCQVFESTNDVEEYVVGEIGKNFQFVDKYLPDSQGFSKWKPIPKEK